MSVRLVLLMRTLFSTLSSAITVNMSQGALFRGAVLRTGSHTWQHLPYSYSRLSSSAPSLAAFSPTCSCPHACSRKSSGSQTSCTRSSSAKSALFTSRTTPPRSCPNTQVQFAKALRSLAGLCAFSPTGYWMSDGVPPFSSFSSSGITTAAATLSPPSRWSRRTPCALRPDSRICLVPMRMI